MLIQMGRTSDKVRTYTKNNKVYRVHNTADEAFREWICSKLLDSTTIRWGEYTKYKTDNTNKLSYSIPEHRFICLGDVVERVMSRDDFVSRLYTKTTEEQVAIICGVLASQQVKDSFGTIHIPQVRHYYNTIAQLDYLLLATRDILNSTGVLQNKQAGRLKVAPVLVDNPLSVYRLDNLNLTGRTMFKLNYAKWEKEIQRLQKSTCITTEHRQVIEVLQKRLKSQYNIFSV